MSLTIIFANASVTVYSASRNGKSENGSRAFLVSMSTNGLSGQLIENPEMSKLVERIGGHYSLFDINDFRICPRCSGLTRR